MGGSGLYNMINASHDTVDLFTLTFLFTADTELTHVAHSRSARSRQAALAAGVCFIGREPRVEPLLWCGVAKLGAQG
jgi:hypothetical protein